MRENIAVKYSYISSSAGLDSFRGFFSLVPIVSFRFAFSGFRTCSFGTSDWDYKRFK